MSAVLHERHINAPTEEVAGEEEEKHGTGGQWSQSGLPGSGADEGTASVDGNDINAVRGRMHVLGTWAEEIVNWVPKEDGTGGWAGPNAAFAKKGQPPQRSTVRLYICLPRRELGAPMACIMPKQRAPG